MWLNGADASPPRSISLRHFRMVFRLAHSPMTQRRQAPAFLSGDCTASLMGRWGGVRFDGYGPGLIPANRPGYFARCMTANARRSLRSSLPPSRRVSIHAAVAPGLYQLANPATMI